MDIPATTLSEILAELRSHDGSLAAVFQTGEGDIGSGYHVTEFKLASIVGIDCAAQISSWNETVLQLLDGQHGNHMPVEKFTTIASKSAENVPGLGEAPFFVEFSPGNRGLRRFQVAGISRKAGRVVLRLSEDRAACKPAAKMAGMSATTNCCGAGEVQSACCS